MFVVVFCVSIEIIIIWIISYEYLSNKEHFWQQKVKPKNIRKYRRNKIRQRIKTKTTEGYLMFNERL